MMQLALYEDSKTNHFYPLAQLRPVFELLCGQATLRERLIRHLPVSSWGAFLRSELVDTYQEAQPEAVLNQTHWLHKKPTLFVNARWIPQLDELLALNENQVAYQEDTIVAMIVAPDEAMLIDPQHVEDSLQTLARARKPIGCDGKLLHYGWDIITHNGRQIELDLTHPGQHFTGVLPAHVSVLGPASNIRVHAGADFDPCVVIDARPGPVIIGAGAKIQAFTRIEGPCFIGTQTHVFRANIKEGTSIGPVCRVGGEVEASVLHSHVNTYHDGFLGHSYVCPWVNMGALTTNSDLKNDYSDIVMPMGGQRYKTGLKKMGCLIGDHTKMAIGSLINTGTSIGIMSMVLPGGKLLPREIPSFCRVWNGELEVLPDIDQMLATASIVMERRNCEFTSAQERLINFLFQSTRYEREQILRNIKDRSSSMAKP
jgi:UDP-N-acetylglucosamine diphosphorylase/glucosamine-1-phosphate N-acetyltransferase